MLGCSEEYAHLPISLIPDHYDWKSDSSFQVQWSELFCRLDKLAISNLWQLWRFHIKLAVQSNFCVQTLALTLKVRPRLYSYKIFESLSLLGNYLSQLGIKHHYQGSNRGDWPHGGDQIDMWPNFRCRRLQKILEVTYFWGEIDVFWTFLRRQKKNFR